MEKLIYFDFNTKRSTVLVRLSTLCLCFFALLFFSSTALAQVNDSIPVDQQTEQLIEDISEANDGADIDYSEITEELSFYLENPLNLNTADPDILKRVFLLNDFQVYKLKAYISTTGELVTLYELNNIEGYDLETIYRILPYVTVAPSLSPYAINLKDVFKYGRHQLFVRYTQVLEEQKGYSAASDSLLAANPNARYLGGPQKIYTKYGFNYRNKIRFGITAEKDPGEEFFAGTQKNGFDFYSAHLFLKDFGIVKALALGDYQLQFGQGLAIWNGLSMGKTVGNLQKNPVGLKPFTSSDENNFMRGAATTLGYKNFKLTMFYSYHYIDGNLGDTLSSEESYITSIQETGYHRTAAEVQDKHAISEQLYGAHLDYKTEHFRLGGTFANSDYGMDLNKNLVPYNQYEFVGKHNQNMSFDYSWMYHGTSFFGEAAMSSNGGWAMINGASLHPDPLVNISLVHRYYQRDYQPIQGTAFGENSKNANEHALYLGTNIILNSKITLDAYADMFSFPWLRYRVDAPSSGTEYLVQLNYTPSRNTQMYVRYRETNKSINLTDDVLLNRVVGTEKSSFRYHISYKPIRNLTLKNRLEIATFKTGDKGVDFGYLAYQDAGYSFSKIPLTVSGRFAVFNTDSYDARLYAFESDVLYAYSIPAYYYKGTRTYLLLKYSISRNIDCWFRISQTWYADEDTISSGLDEISGHNKTDIHAQIRLKF